MERTQERRIETPEVERRAFVGKVELRAAPEGSKSPGTLVGYAAVYDKLSLDLGYFREKLAKGCFADALKRCDVRALKNHDDNLLLGRNTAGTLRMEEDELGLPFEVDLPDTSAGRDVAVEVGRGDMSGCSFSFTTDVDEWDWSGQVPIRTIRQIRDLFDVGPVTYPAYDQTSVACRSFSRAQAEREKPKTPVLSLAKARQQLAEAELVPSYDE